MPRFYFHLRSRDGLSRDTEGLVYPDLEAAYLAAYAAAKDRWAEQLAKHRNPTRDVFEITDGSGQLLLTVPVVEILDGIGGSGCRTRPAAAAKIAAERVAQMTQLLAELSEQIGEAQMSINVSRKLLEGLPRRSAVGLKGGAALESDD